MRRRTSGRLCFARRNRTRVYARVFHRPSRDKPGSRAACAGLRASPLGLWIPTCVGMSRVRVVRQSSSFPPERSGEREASGGRRGARGSWGLRRSLLDLVHWTKSRLRRRRSPCFAGMTARGGVSTPSSFETIARWMSAVRTVGVRSLRMRAIGLLGFAAGVVSLCWVSVFALGRPVGAARVAFTRMRRQII